MHSCTSLQRVCNCCARAHFELLDHCVWTAQSLCPAGKQPMILLFGGLKENYMTSDTWCSRPTVNRIHARPTCISLSTTLSRSSAFTEPIT